MAPPNAPRGIQPINYSRFDHIGSSDEEESPRRRPVAATRSQPPSDVREDLEDYFRRLDERRSGVGAGGSDLHISSVEGASVERFTADQIAQLKTFEHVAGEGTEDSSARTECAICLCEFEAGEALTVLPCAAEHAFHSGCVHSALSRSVQCPLCRVDVRALLSASPTRQPPTPRQLGFTRDGGIIQRYEPNPPADLPRPSYIPRRRASQAEMVEIMYPDYGVARVWRLPREDIDGDAAVDATVGAAAPDEGAAEGASPAAEGASSTANGDGR